MSSLAGALPIVILPSEMKVYPDILWKAPLVAPYTDCKLNPDESTFTTPAEMPPPEQVEGEMNKTPVFPVGPFVQEEGIDIEKPKDLLVYVLNVEVVVDDDVGVAVGLDKEPLLQPRAMIGTIKNIADINLSRMLLTFHVTQMGMSYSNPNESNIE